MGGPGSGRKKGSGKGTVYIDKKSGIKYRDFSLTKRKQPKGTAVYSVDGKKVYKGKEGKNWMK